MNLLIGDGMKVETYNSRGGDFRSCAVSTEYGRKSKRNLVLIEPAMSNHKSKLALEIYLCVDS